MDLKSTLAADYSDPLTRLSESFNDLFGAAGLSAYLELDLHLTESAATYDWSEAPGPTEAAEALGQYLDDNWIVSLPGLGEASFGVTAIEGRCRRVGGFYIHPEWRRHL